MGIQCKPHNYVQTVTHTGGDGIVHRIHWQNKTITSTLNAANEQLREGIQHRPAQQLITCYRFASHMLWFNKISQMFGFSHSHRLFYECSFIVRLAFLGNWHARSPRHWQSRKYEPFERCPVADEKLALSSCIEPTVWLINIPALIINAFCHGKSGTKRHTPNGTQIFHIIRTFQRMFKLVDAVVFLSRENTSNQNLFATFSSALTMFSPRFFFFFSLFGTCFMFIAAVSHESNSQLS